MHVNGNPGSFVRGALAVAVALAAGIGGARPIAVSAAPPPTDYLQLTATATAGSLPAWNGVVSVAPGGSYTVTTPGCGTGWTLDPAVRWSRYPAGEVVEPNPAVTVSQSDAGLTISRSVPSDVTAGPLRFQNYIVPYVEALDLTCTRGAEVAVGTAVAYVEPYAEFVRWERQFAPHVVLGWQIQAIACSVATAATLSITSSSYVGTIATTIRSDGVAYFAATPVDPSNPTVENVPWAAVFNDPTAVFVVSCTGADGSHSLTLTSNATTVPATPETPTTLPGTGASAASTLTLAAAALAAGAALLSTSRRRRART